MNPQILDYLDTQRTGVLAVEMPDGAPHGATVHFAYTKEPFVFYFETNRDYKKSEALFARDNSRASFVIGTQESEMKTFQMDGTVSLVNSEDMDHYRAVYLGKFNEKQDKSQDPKFVAFTFTPTWWRFTDFKNPEGRLILTSD